MNSGLNSNESEREESTLTPFNYIHILFSYAYKNEYFTFHELT